MEKITVLGGGSWGTAFANYLTFKKHDIKLWVREPEVVEAIENTGINSYFLKDIKLSEFLKPVTDIVEAVKWAEIVVIAIPSKFLRNILMELKDHLKDKKIVNLSKGFESRSMKTLSQVAVEVMGEEILENWVTVSGPSFAKELALNHPTAVAAASGNASLLKEIQESFSSETLRLYRTEDLTGVEVSGSMKNVIAIASGMCNGCGFGYNTTASLVTRASVEISRLGTHLGATRDTFWGLAGIGDLMLTCFGTLSRNYQLGTRIAKGETLEEIQKSTITVAEGVETTKAIFRLSEKLGIDMPITGKVHEILFDKKEPLYALKELMQRSLKKE